MSLQSSPLYWPDMTNTAYVSSITRHVARLVLYIYIYWSLITSEDKRARKGSETTGLAKAQQYIVISNEICWMTYKAVNAIIIIIDRSIWAAGGWAISLVDTTPIRSTFNSWADYKVAQPGVTWVLIITRLMLKQLGYAASHTHTHARAHTHTRVHTCTHTHTRVHKCTYAHTEELLSHWRYHVLLFYICYIKMASL